MIFKPLTEADIDIINDVIESPKDGINIVVNTHTNFPSIHSLTVRTNNKGISYYVVAKTQGTSMMNYTKDEFLQVANSVSLTNDISIFLFSERAEERPINAPVLIPLSFRS